MQALAQAITPPTFGCKLQSFPFSQGLVETSPFQEVFSGYPSPLRSFSLASVGLGDGPLSHVLLTAICPSTQPPPQPSILYPTVTGWSCARHWAAADGAGTSVA